MAFNARLRTYSETSYYLAVIGTRATLSFTTYDVLSGSVRLQPPYPAETSADSSLAGWRRKVHRQVLPPIHLWRSPWLPCTPNVLMPHGYVAAPLRRWMASWLPLVRYSHPLTVVYGSARPNLTTALVILLLSCCVITDVLAQSKRYIYGSPYQQCIYVYGSPATFFTRTICHNQHVRCVS